LKEKSFLRKIKRERFHFLLLLVFFLASGIYYMHITANDAIVFGEAMTTDEIETLWASEHEVVSSFPEGGVDINNAEAEVLMLLPGIGEVTAAAIVDYRKENGRFDAIEEIMNVSGIGEKTFEKIKTYIVLN